MPRPPPSTAGARHAAACVLRRCMRALRWTFALVLVAGRVLVARLRAARRSWSDRRSSDQGDKPRQRSPRSRAASPTWGTADIWPDGYDPAVLAEFTAGSPVTPTAQAVLDVEIASRAPTAHSWMQCGSVDVNREAIVTSARSSHLSMTASSYRKTTPTPARTLRRRRYRRWTDAGRRRSQWPERRLRRRRRRMSCRPSTSSPRRRSPDGVCPRVGKTSCVRILLAKRRVSRRALASGGADALEQFDVGQVLRAPRSANPGAAELRQ